MHKQSIDRLTAAQGVLELLGRLDVRKLPSEERMAVAVVEVKALDEWLAAAPRGLRVPLIRSFGRLVREARPQMSDNGRYRVPQQEPGIRGRINGALESAGRWLSRLIGRR
jgi:hypothetical protein